MNRCRACNRVGDDIGTCGRFATCPSLMGEAPTPLIPEKDSLIRCESCGIERAFPCVEAFKGSKTIAVDHTCPHPDSCGAVLVLATAGPAKAKKAPAKSAEDLAKDAE